MPMVALSPQLEPSKHLQMAPSSGNTGLSKPVTRKHFRKPNPLVFRVKRPFPEPHVRPQNPAAEPECVARPGSRPVVRTPRRRVCSKTRILTSDLPSPRIVIRQSLSNRSRFTVADIVHCRQTAACNLSQGKLTEFIRNRKSSLEFAKGSAARRVTADVRIGKQEG